MEVTMYSRSLSLGLCIAMCCIFLTTETFAWEFKLRSSSVFEYDYYSHNVTNGFFGPLNVDMGTNTGGDFASVNGWLGLQVNNLTSGSDASRSYFSTYLYPEITLNPAINLRGAYRIGSNDTGTFPGMNVAFAYIEALWWTIGLETPLGRIDYGKRAFEFGCGLQYDGGYRSEEYLSLISTLGPFSMGAYIYPYRRAILVDEVVQGQPYWNSNDKNSTSRLDLFGFIKYAAGPLDVGVGGTCFSYHFGPEGYVRATNRVNIPGLSVSSSEGFIYSKYTNGRFFFNAEADWYYRTANYVSSFSGAILDSQGDLELQNTDGSGSIFRPQYTEWWRWMVQFGFLSGPCKVSFLYSFIPGPDRRHGVLIDKQPVLINLLSPNVDIVVYQPQHTNYDVFRPYSMLLGPSYGAGELAQAVGNLGATPAGYMVDASILATRVDYAVASNLNLYASFLYANRASKSGHGWGSIGPLIPAGITPETFAIVVQSQRDFTSPFPSIPDNNLGWEVTGGFDWNLLEKWVMSLSAGYWQPGKWFNYACIDRSVPGWDVPTSANLWGTNPNRSIDPVFGLTWTMTNTF